MVNVFINQYCKTDPMRLEKGTESVSLVVTYSVSANEGEIPYFPTDKRFGH